MRTFLYWCLPHYPYSATDGEEFDEEDQISSGSEYEGGNSNIRQFIQEHQSNLIRDLNFSKQSS